MTSEQQRLQENSHKKIPLEQWGPYVSERQWGTVREDYSYNGDPWNYFPFEQSHYRSYLWGEDGIAGISDYFQNLCFAISLWNRKDPILKERHFGLANKQGNHGEDVKELYYYLDNLPSHYYMEYLYKYPQQEFPYEKIRTENKLRSKREPEYEILDTGIFDNNEYFDVCVTYAKQDSHDIFIKINIHNRYSESAGITVLPTLWFYNRSSNENLSEKPVITSINKTTVKATHERLGTYYLYFQSPRISLFTDNITNQKKVTGKTNPTPFVKDAFHDAIIRKKNIGALRKRNYGTKFAPVYDYHIPAGESKTIYLRLSDKEMDNGFDPGFENIFSYRKTEADDFYNAIIPANTSEDRQKIARQAMSGLLWNKQYYHYDVEKWLTTSDGITPVNNGKLFGRNHDWKHLKNQNILSMPDKWEFPWYAAWDLAFHCIPMAMLDPCFAKHQLLLMMREWYMKPDGQLPAYEWHFSDVNPPVQAWAALQIYRIEKTQNGKGDISFLKKIFQKLIINFTWWINRKDAKGNNIFHGGFLGLDNIGLFNRSIELPGNRRLEQADGTSWMGMYALNMMDIALEIAVVDDTFEEMATKFYEHFILIAEALNQYGLWNDEDKFFYDVFGLTDASPIHLRIQSIVGLTTLFAVSTIQKKVRDLLPDFKKRSNWIEKYRGKNNLFWPNEERAEGDKILLSLIQQNRLKNILQHLLNEEEFLSPGGIRALSKYHEMNHYTITLDNVEYSIQYDPGDSTSDLFGGNSNWRGPVWVPINYLIIQSIKKYGEFYGDELLVECPTGSGNQMNLKQVADELARRVISLFEKDADGKRKLNGKYNWFYHRPENQDLILFYEYFHGDDGNGLGASHQTGWTSLVACLVNQLAKNE
ncbi:MAG TPA: glucosidase [Hanamia sp.]|nr:glucosidase [Hanamia sp.]